MSEDGDTVDGLTTDRVHGRSREDQDTIKVFTQYLEAYHHNTIEAILDELDDTTHYSVEIDCLHLQDIHPSLVDRLLASSHTTLPLLDEAIVATQQAILRESQGYIVSLKPHCHARFRSLPANPETAKANVSCLRSCDATRFIVIQGTVIRAGMVKMLESEREYQCKKCKHVFTVNGDVEMGNVIQIPAHCPSESCVGTNFDPTDAPPLCRDYQEIKIQEQIQHLTMGFIPRSIVVVLTDDLVDACKAGDDVIITATVLRRWSTLKAEGRRCDVDLFLYANHVTVSQESKVSHIPEELQNDFERFWASHASTPFAGRQAILSVVCPQLFGMIPVKLALMLAIIGGVTRTDKSGMRIRGESHLLLVGDPGTGKSECLRFAAQTAPRAVLTNGIGSTSAGLTVTAVRDNSGEWMLEAGALVLADGGVCCVDEFDAMREHDRTTIHEAMEQQTVSVAKAGLVCKLHTRTTLIAAINPKGKYDTDADISVNVAIASPLLSRFDLVMVMLDTQDAEWDKNVCGYILDQTQYLQRDAANVSSSPSNNRRETPGWQVWDQSRLRAYVSYVRRVLQPELTHQAEQVLSKYYQVQRATDGRNAARTTIRMLESLVRVAQAHARLMFRKEVELEDAVTAVLCLEASKHTSSLVPFQSPLKTSASDSPDTDYLEMEEKVLDRLGLQHLSEHSIANRPPPPPRSFQTQARPTQAPSGPIELSATSPAAPPLSSDISAGMYSDTQAAENLSAVIAAMDTDAACPATQHSPIQHANSAREDASLTQHAPLSQHQPTLSQPPSAPSSPQHGSSLSQLPRPPLEGHQLPPSQQPRPSQQVQVFSVPGSTQSGAVVAGFEPGGTDYSSLGSPSSPSFV